MYVESGFYPGRITFTAVEHTPHTWWVRKIEDYHTADYEHRSRVVAEALITASRESAALTIGSSVLRRRPKMAF